MSISIPEVERLAHLARISIDKNEAQKTAKKLSDIFVLIDELNNANTEEVTSSSHPLSMTQRFRPDEITETDQRDYIQEVMPSPEVEQGLFLVPKVIE
jgi:aspartyl-tRNA(Asn)/glutamyl-tRNA(Gln) amidotransferase subunit C